MTTWLWVDGGSTADSTVVRVMGAMLGEEESVWIGRWRELSSATSEPEAKRSELGTVTRGGNELRPEWRRRDCASDERRRVREGRKSMSGRAISHRRLTNPDRGSRHASDADKCSSCNKARLRLKLSCAQASLLFLDLSPAAVLYALTSSCLCVPSTAQF